MDTKKLRQKILDLAIRGKLVPQDPNDEPASVLLERIRAEKERLIKEGKIKRSKKSASDEIEAPFEIPESWEWTTIEEICSSIIAGGDKPDVFSVSKTKECNFPVYTNAILNDGLYGYSNIPTILEPAITISARGTIGFVCTRRTPFTPIVRLITAIPIRADIDYISYALKILAKPAEGSSIPQLTVPTFKYTLVPIPPLKEQHRIVSLIERWFTLIDELESNEGDLLKAIDKAKSKILDLAIHGKLVPQDPNDEPAIELLKRINPKFEPCGETPWDLPNNWCWTTLGNISNYGKCIHVEAKDIPNDSWVLELEDLEKDTAKLLQRVTCAERDIKGIRSLFRKGDVLFSKLRTYLNKVLVAPEDGYCSTEIVPISLRDSLSSHYINHVLRSKYFVEYTTSCGYGVKMPRLSTTDACKGLIPLPPKTEQLRIVSKIEELFAVLDSIKESTE